MESAPGPRVRTQVRLSPQTHLLLADRVAQRGGSASAVITQALSDHLPLPTPPRAPDGGELVRFRVPFALHQLAVVERRRWTCSLSAVVETALRRSLERTSTEGLQEFRRR